MNFSFDDTPQECIISFLGRLTFNDHAKMRALIREATRRDKIQIIFDLRKLEFIDSAGVGMILIAKGEFESHQKNLTLRHAAGQVMRVITVSQLSKLVTVDA